MDMQCDECALPIDGHVEMTATGNVVKAVEVSVGDREFLGSRSKSYRAHPITTVPERAAETQITIRGQLTIPAAPRKGAVPSPSVRLFRLSVTR